jgi:hypothetical protein
LISISDNSFLAYSNATYNCQLTFVSYRYAWIHVFVLKFCVGVFQVWIYKITASASSSNLIFFLAIWMHFISFFHYLY